MHHAAFVGFAQGFEDLLADVETAFVAERAFLFEDFGEREPVEPFHGDEEKSGVGLAVVENRDGVGVSELACEEGFLPELLDIIAVVGDDVGEENFEGDFAPEVILHGAVYRTESAQTHALNDRVPIGQAVAGIGKFWFDDVSHFLRSSRKKGAVAKHDMRLPYVLNPSCRAIITQTNFFEKARPMWIRGAYARRATST